MKKPSITLQVAALNKQSPPLTPWRTSGTSVHQKHKMKMKDVLSSGTCRFIPIKKSNPRGLTSLSKTKS